MASPETISAAEYLTRNPNRDHRGEPDRVTADQFNGTVGKSWDRPLTGDELTDEVHGFMPRVIKAFQANGCGFIYHTTDPRKCRAGFPDLRIVHHNVGIVAELKVKIGPQHIYPEQVDWLDVESTADNAWVFLWTPADWDFICRLARGGGLMIDEPSRWVNRRDLFVRGAKS